MVVYGYHHVSFNWNYAIPWQMSFETLLQCHCGAMNGLLVVACAVVEMPMMSQDAATCGGIKVNGLN